MGSVLVSEEQCIISTDVGIFQVKTSEVTGYDIEDIVHDRAVSQARAVQLSILGKLIDPTSPTTPRSIPSVWLNNDVELS